MTQFEFIQWQETGPIATVWMHRPPANAVNQAMYVEIKRFFDNVDELLPEARVVVLAGRGKHFCGGNDLAEFQTLDPANSPSRMKQVREAFFSIYDSTKPTIAAVQGAAVGTGLCLAASCDLIVAAESARFALPEVNVGVMGGAKHLSRLVPQGMVRMMHLSGDLIPASRLLPYGGIVDVVADDKLLDTAQDLAASLARHSPAALRFAKQSLNTIEYMDLKAGYEFEQSLTAELSGYEDSKEAVNAFIERRAPVYTGR
ncbi:MULTISPECIES: enoyl-CoA hydratase-related protein [unclassified Rhodococcus (in: high G+C Gram-positive bacteria)]|uniref:enoyl-CoA hydratase-related protein n=1 Tax=unclassified Rhodococcus (in: high G+C Gram-positive bacteria) TaxID=192944 RepID=UPI001639B5FE|nr:MULTISPECIES: enoyl-CoA hydratase-related protein [unclassified Rhodococcus (in: high G+C Gram-positive bacteria)]MBC2640755.1 enoyl-CoA hydratase/isomerase family protein [Rhodococcus sp. 3A]MBC2894500.1 enoyl-CoA hydratase/isomerase family protein [Rhodococcus sp. 4CII]